jgi:predicted double-glycine peptidase
MNFLGFVAIILAVGGFFAFHYHFKSKSLKVKFYACILSGTFALPSLFFAIYYLHVFPERAWFYELRSWPGSELLTVFLGALGGVIATLLPRFLLVIPMAFTVLITFVPYLKMILYPFKVDYLKERWESDACLQSTESTCGPASAASILRFLGENASEGEIARSTFSTASGTEAWYLARYFRARNLTTKFEFHSTFSTNISLPAIIGLRVGGFGHFVAVLKICDGLVTFVDPLCGKQELKIKEFQKTHIFTGFHLSVIKKNSKMR